MVKGPLRHNWGADSKALDEGLYNSSSGEKIRGDLKEFWALELKGIGRMETEKARKEINAIDGKIVELLNKRLGLAMKIGKEKKLKGEGVYDPAREEEIIASLKEENKGNLRNDSLEVLFREIFSISRNAQQHITIACLGPQTTFSHVAAMKHFGSSANYECLDSIKEVFTSVEKGEADMGIVPIENSLGGSVIYTYDMFMVSPLNIVAEISEPISHNLISPGRLQDIEKLYVHPQALAQCREWIAKNLPNAEIIEVSSTAKSVESAKIYLKSAGIGSELSAAHYGLNIVAKNIQDKENNVTRFLVIGKSRPKKAAKLGNKTSIMFTVKNEPGALFTALEPLKKLKVNMTKIESRPGNVKNWDYVFFVDVQGYFEDEKISKALAQMKKNTDMLRVLGSYPEKPMKSEN